MRLNSFARLQLLMIVSCLVVFAAVMATDHVFGAPTQSPPSGNPAFPQGPAGPKGPLGNQGYQGNQGQQGNQGNQGPQGPVGSVSCDWTGKDFYVSNGWDIGACQFYRGLWISCDSSNRTYAFSNFNGNGCGYYQQ